MDMTVYSKEDNTEYVDYYQMKHSEAHSDTHMTLGLLRKTIEGFSKRYKFHATDSRKRKVKYLVVTNRGIDHKLLTAIKKLANGDVADKRIRDQLVRYTKLSGLELKAFCSCLILQGGEGNYEEQFYSLVGDTARLITGVNNTDIVNKLINMIWDRVLPNNRSEITKEIVLNQFGCSSEKHLYPAPSSFEKLDGTVKRDEYVRLAKAISEDERPKIITATGGIGKSIFTGMLSDLLGEEHLTVIYDCFGNGTYRNRLMFRHRHQDALVQIANELADLGYCEPLIPVDKDPDWISESFHERISEAIRKHKALYPNGKLVIAIDAADNAEMAGEINEQYAFPSDLLQQGLPPGCILVMLCRPEREHMLKAPRDVITFRMAEFTAKETERYLSSKFPGINTLIAEEVHRLTNGIPRVMSIAMQESQSLKEFLDRLGPIPTTAEDQIEHLLEQAKNRISDQLSDRYMEEINSLCCGLAVLPPDIPLSDFSAIAMISDEAIKSFVSEMGAQIIITDDHLHFRDEPTEHWFQKTFSGNYELVKAFIARIEPLTENSIYLAASLPELYISIGLYDKMIDVVLEGKFLPKMVEADIREVEYTRLRFAVRAAINADRYKNLIALGLMAGDKGEVNNRIYSLYQEHFDIVHKFLSKEPLRELAYKSKLRGDWLGSDQLYTALLLSGTEDGAPEARIYLRNARQFLQVYFEERKREDRDFNGRLTDDDIFAFILTTYNIFGLEEAINDIKSWSPAELRFKISRKLASYLIDLSAMHEGFTFLDKVTDDVYSFIAIVLEFDKVGLYPDEDVINRIATILQIEEFDFSDNYMLNEDEAAPMLAIVTFCERLISNKETDLCKKLIDMLLRKFGPSDFKSDFYNYKRAIYLRAYAIKKHLDSEFNFFDHEYFNTKNSERRYYQDKDTVKGIFNSLYPWYELRLKIILEESNNITEKVLDCRRLSGLSYEGQYCRFNSIEKERYVVAADIFLKCHWEIEAEAMNYYNEVIEKERYGMPRDRVALMRGLMHTSNFYTIIQKLEFSIHEMIVNDFSEPYERVETLMQMVRSFLGYSHREARIYFEEAVNENERFGDDLPNKWSTISSIARRAADAYNDEEKLAYRFVRVAEFVGEHVVREKYWDRNEAMRITTLLSPVQGMAAISRWRERNVGWVEDQLKHVIESLIDKKILSSEQIWGMSGFFPDSEYYVIKLAKEAMKLAGDTKKVEIARQVNRIAGLKGYSRRNCEELKELFGLLPEFEMPAYPGIEDSILNLNSSSTYKTISESEIDSLLGDWGYDGIESLKRAFGYVNSVEGLNSNNDYFWQRLMDKVPLPMYGDFLTEVLTFTNDFWSVTRILTNIPNIWKRSRSFLRFWLDILKDFGRTFASDILSSYYRRPLEERSGWSDQEWYQIYTGCIEAYKTNYSEFGASDYYDLASIGSMIELPDKSLTLLDKALQTMEKDIDINFADGIVDDTSLATGTFDEAYGSFFKASLGSPDSEVHWMAVHGLVRFCMVSDEKQVKELIETIISADTDAFLGKKFLFYEMNYQLYMLIALQRIALEQPYKLCGIKHIFAPYFEEGYSHGLIQLTVFKIINLLREYSADLFSVEEFAVAEKWFVSPKQIAFIGNHNNTKMSDRYEQLAKCAERFHVAFDFDRYWLNTLERIFNIPTKHLEMLIGNYVRESLELKPDENGWIHDERNDVFRSSKYELRTHTSHGELPSAERISFYLSYHGMFVIAGRLLKNETLYLDDYYEEAVNPYMAWLERNYLYREDGFMLFDGRTPTPVGIPAWMNSRIDESWLIGVDKDYLYQNMRINGDVCVDGYWEYQRNGFRETVTVDTALVDKSMIFSLMVTLEELPPHDYYLGNSDDFDEETDELFNMENWIIQRNSYSELDKHDPWAKGTKYPDYEIKESYASMLDLTVNKLRNKWTEADNGRVMAYIENWVENLGQYNDDYFQPNTRLIAKEELLINLCKETEKALIVNVKIDRRKVEDRYSSDDGREAHCFHAFKVIDADGWWNDEG
ncbi:ATP-binding protein [Anaerovorax sp. IOR16]|uniref:ATP-binding protein n=1 Tax=Anaerovorax sp. IOR16 TaxID=2773458 RepID=UPI0019D0AD3D|nr:ATP-binding protein [Anaerovorax sp. IOR16]